MTVNIATINKEGVAVSIGRATNYHVLAEGARGLGDVLNNDDGLRIVDLVLDGFRLFDAALNRLMVHKAVWFRVAWRPWDGGSGAMCYVDASPLVACARNALWTK